ncbi:hypothetical protein KSS87_001936 [Heliosperma pusillum]|nr:hypothetical protein KSS87_001936 [Heliosperma pusillum]
MALLLCFALFFTLTAYSSGQYCLCKPGSAAPDPYQKVINYACGNGANCGPIQPNGLCYQANNIQAICSYAANSYYQNEKSLGATCDFGGVAVISPTLPSDLPSGCTYPTTAGPTGPISNSTGIPTSPPGGISTPPGGLNTGPGTTSPPGIFSPTDYLWANWQLQ